MSANSGPLTHGSAKLIAERDSALAALRTCLPIVEAAWYDHQSAASIPGAGYNHRVYSKLPWDWGGNAFNAWAKAVRDLLAVCEDEAKP